MGAIGYFPTYTLGNLYAAQLWEATLRDLPDLPQQIAAGKTAPLLEWMRSHIHVHGSRWEPEELVQRASGAEPGAEAFVRYLKAKFGELYGLA
jgi:carboxypeptidase Taq